MLRTPRPALLVRSILSRGVVLLILALSMPVPVSAIEDLATEENIADLLLTKPVQREGPRTTEERQWAVLPQVGYGPDTGPVVGLKFTDRDLFGTGMTLDLDGTLAALNQKESYTVTLEQPHLADDRFLFTLQGKFKFDPQRRFFSLGNNNRGPDPASTEAFQEAQGTAAFGWRPVPQLALNLSVQYRDLSIRRGHHLSDCGGFAPCPFTIDEFPDMPGVHGGHILPLSLSLVWDTRDEIVRPTRGWRLLLKFTYAPKWLVGDFEFIRMIGDVGYLRSFLNKRLIAGIRLDGEWIHAPFGRLPFWELAELGGSDTLRGFFPHRFLGKERLLINTEVRALLTEFDFFDLWHVKLDGILFGEAGRVFLENDDLANEFHAARPDIRLRSGLRYSGGTGLRIQLSEALVASIDVGFSSEEQGLVYLTFGHTF